MTEPSENLPHGAEPGGFRGRRVPRDRRPRRHVHGRNGRIPKCFPRTANGCREGLQGRRLREKARQDRHLLHRNAFRRTDIRIEFRRGKDGRSDHRSRRRMTAPGLPSEPHGNENGRKQNFHRPLPRSVRSEIHYRRVRKIGIRKGFGKTERRKRIRNHARNEGQDRQHRRQNGFRGAEVDALAGGRRFEIFGKDRKEPLTGLRYGSHRPAADDRRFRERKRVDRRLTASGTGRLPIIQTE